MAKRDDSSGDIVAFVSDAPSVSPRSIVKNLESTDSSLWLTRKRNLLFAFSIASLPLLIIAIILLVFVFQPSRRETPTNPPNSTYLPVPQQDFSGVYWTARETGSFLLLGSWASNMATIIAAPFMIIYSYIIARTVVQESAMGAQVKEERPRFFSEVLRGGPVGLYPWGKYLVSGEKRLTLHQKAWRLGVINVAGFGMLTTCILTLLVVIGDNWLHTTTNNFSFTWYSPIQNFTDEEGFNLTGSWDRNPSVRTNGSLCERYLQNEIQLPCSIEQTNNGLVTLVDPEDIYPTLLSGISTQNESLNAVDFTEKAKDPLYTDFEIITFLQNGSYHSIYFSASAAAEYPYGEAQVDGIDFLVQDYGIDFMAQTYSMSTQCSIITSDCNLTALTNSSKMSDQNNIKIPFNCYDYFSGDLGQTPSNGHEKAQGWNTSFYSLENGTRRNISVEEQLNPFPFYVTAAVNSISPDSYDAYHVNATDSHDLIAVDGGLTAFALSCNAIVYNVSYSIVNGSLIDFSATIAPPAIAAIIKAPLQVGFGSYHLYEQVQGAVLSYDADNPQALADTMAIALSQTGMALASGAFSYEDPSYNGTKLRIHYTNSATAVPKAPFWFLVLSSLLYSLVSAVLTLVAFLLRRRPPINEEQARLMASVAQGRPKKHHLEIDLDLQ